MLESVFFLQALGKVGANVTLKLYQVLDYVQAADTGKRYNAMNCGWNLLCQSQILCYASRRNHGLTQKIPIPAQCDFDEANPPSL